jgi:hypothetical protein
MADITKLFEFLYETVIEEGGDGDAVVISENYEQYAEEFDAWQKLNSYNWKKQSTEGVIGFTDNQEAITFCSIEEGKHLPTWMFTKVYLY